MLQKNLNKAVWYLFFPAIKIAFYFWYLFSVESGALDAFAFLVYIVIEQEETMFAKHYNGYQVTKGYQAHEQITKAPCQFKTCYGSKINHYGSIH
jgi:hypothetical protein